MHAVASLLYIFQRSMQADRKMSLARKKRPFTSYPKTQQMCHYKQATKPSGLLLLYAPDVDFSSRNNFANLDSFAKVSVPV